MKKSIVILTLTLLVTFAVSFISAQDNEVELSDLKYGRVSAYTWVQADVLLKNNNKRVMWFQLFDQVEKQSTIDGYKSRYVKRIGKYPAKIAKDMHIWMLIGNRFEIRLIGDSKASEFRNTGKLRSFIMKFDIEGMEDYSGPKLTGKQMKKYCPKLSN